MKKQITKIMTFVIMFLLSVLSVNATTYYSQVSGDPKTLTNWKSSRDGLSGSNPTVFSTSGDVFIIQGTGNGGTTPHTMTSGNTMTFGAGVTLEVEGGATLVQSSTITMNASATFKLDAGSFYQHSSTSYSNFAAGIENWSSSATITYTKSGFIPNTSITGGVYPNVVINNGSNVNFAGVITNISGNLTVTNGASSVTLTGATALNMTIGGNLTLTTASTFDLGNGAAAPIVNIGGNISIASGISFTYSGSGGSSSLNFTKSGTQTFSNAGTMAAKVINYTVNNGSTLDLGTNVISGTGSFTVASGGGIISANTNATGALTTSGANGSIQVTGTRTYNTGGNYTFNGVSAQVAGNGLTGANNLTINNTDGLTLSAATAVSGILTLTSGVLTTTGTNLLTLGSAATVSGGSSSSFVSGPMQHTIASTSSTAKTFPLGKGSAYAPAVLTITQSAATSTTYKAEVFASGITSLTLPGTISAVSSSRYYALSSSGSIISNGSIGLVYDANDAGVTLSDKTAIRVVKDDGAGAWLNLGPDAGGSGNSTGNVTSTSNFSSLGNFAIATAVLGTPATVSTEAVTAINPTTATGNGTITNVGSSNIVTSGVCWSTTSGAENVSGNHSTDGPTGATTGAFTSSMTGLSAGQTYYVKAYASNTETTGYGSEVTLKTQATVTSASVSSLLQTTATCGGTITSAGSYSEKGICWSTSENPTTTDAHTTNGTGSGNGTFSNDMSSLLANTDYHVRAYVTNESGTTYGADVPFKTLAEVPTIAVSKNSLTDFGSVTANQVSSTQTYTVSGTYLTSIVTITPPVGFQISSNGGTDWVSNPSTIILTQTAGSLDAQPVTITARFNPNAVSSFSANITHTATDATSQNVALSGTGIAVTNPTALTVSKKSDNIVYMTWTAPSGSYDKVLVFAQVATDVTVSPSGAGSAYTGDNLAWGSAAIFGAGSDKLVYSGTGTSAEVTGLTNVQTYYFKVYSYSGDSYGVTPATANFTTAVQPTTSLGATVANAQSVLTWTNPTYNVTQTNYWNEVLVVAKSGGAVDATPSGDGSSYTANAAFGSGTDLGSGNFVVYKGTAATETVTGLTNNTAYHYATFVRHGSEWSASNTANATPNQYTIGDYKSVANTNWDTYTTWNKWNGTSWVATASGDYPNSTTASVFIAAGTTVTYATGGRNMKNLTVEGTLTTTAVVNSPAYLQVYGDVEVLSGGLIGIAGNLNGNNASGIAISTYGSSTQTIKGSGTISVTRLRLNSANTVIVDADIYINYHGSSNTGNASALYPMQTGSTLTLNEGKTITMDRWSCIYLNTTSTTQYAYSFTMNINGTLNFLPGSPSDVNDKTLLKSYFLCNNSSGTFAVNIGTNGSMNVNDLYLNGNSQAGTSTGSATFVNNGILNINLIGDFSRSSTQAITGTGTVNLLTGAEIKVANTDGLNNSTGNIQTTTANYNTGANYNFMGSSAQVTGSLLPATVNNLVLNNSTGLTLSGSTAVNGALTLTAGNLTIGSNTLTINGTTSGAGYIDNTAGTVTYGGSSSQTVSNILSSTFNNLIIDNASGVNLAANYTSSNLTINSSKVLNVAAGKQLTVSTTMTNNGTLNLLSDASGTATILTPASISGTTGTVNVNQYLGTARNWYVSSPISNAKAPAGYTYYQRDEAGASWTTQPFVAGNTFVAGKGYIAMPVGTGATITFTTESGGNLNTGSVPVDLTWSGTSSKGFNLIGNPYPSHLTWTKAFTDANASLIEPSIYLRTNAGSTNSSGQWSFPTYSALSGESLNGGTAIIPPMQAFWVRAVAAGTLTLNSNLTRSHQASNPLKAPAAKNIDRQRLRLEITNGISKDETLVFFDAAALDALDAYDTPKMSNNNVAIPEIYTLAGGEQLGINGLTAVTPNKELALGFNTGSANTFTIKATQVSNFDADTKIYLRDNLLNTEQELTVGTSYTFSSDVTNTTTRFSVIFKSTAIATGIGNNPYDYQNIAINTNGNNQITIRHNNGEKGSVTVCNAIGQKLMSTQITGTSTVIGKQFSSGVYLVTVGNESNKVTKKVIIK